MKSKIDNLRLNFKIWLETIDQVGVLGDKKCDLLKAINETGSLNDAIKKMGLTYRKTWDNLHKIEKELGFPLIKPTRGGLEGGNTVLTTEGKIIVAAFDKFHTEYDSIIRSGFETILSEMKQKIK
ncbi:MAG: LysR family transcriptional regulator [Bacteroidales bacterium]|jgi:molybdate transport repressor ModE-like protein|nr:LysR family transcriptional regulator [Bacteroidales bacterium]